MAKYNTNEDILAVIKGLSSRLERIERTNQLPLSSVALPSGGDITMQQAAENADSASAIIPDGVVPAQPQNLLAIGGLGQIFLKWTGVTTNALGDPQTDQITYLIYGSDTDTFPLDDTTLITTTTGTMKALRTLTDDVKFVYLNPDNTPKIYYFQIVPQDKDGMGVASSIVQGSMDQAAEGDLAAGSVTATQLSALLVLASILSTRSQDVDGNLVGTGTDLTPDGLFSYDSAGNLRFTLPNDATLAAVLRGDAEIDHLTVKILTSLFNTSLGQAATFRLENAITSPSNPPAPVIDYASVKFGDPTKWDARVGFAGNGTNYYTLRNTAVGDCVVEKWSTTGTLQQTSTSVLSFVGTGVTVTNDSVYMLGHTASNYYLIRWNPTTLARQEQDIITSSLDGVTIGAAIGWDPNTNELLIAQNRQTNSSKLRFQRWTFDPASSTATLQSGVVNTVESFNANLSYILYGTFDLTGPRWISTSRLSSGVHRLYDATGARDTVQEWDVGFGSQGLVGLIWNGTAFEAMGQDGTKYTYEPGAGNKWTSTADATWYAAYTYSNASVPAQSVLSPYATFTMRKRARVTITGGALPNGVTEEQIYLRKGSTAPNIAAPPSMTLQGPTTGTTSPKLIVTNANFGTFNDPLTSGFGAGVPAEILSTESATDPLWQILGSGAGRAGPSRWGANGIPILTNDWVTPTLNAPYTAVSGRTPRYRMDSAGNVHLRGGVNINGAADGATVFTLPTGFRPSSETRFTNDSTPVPTSSTRVIIGTDGTVSHYPKSGTPTQGFLDTVFSIA